MNAAGWLVCKIVEGVADLGMTAKKYNKCTHNTIENLRVNA